MLTEWFSLTNTTDSDILITDKDIPGGTQLVPAGGTTDLRLGPYRRALSRNRGLLPTDYVNAQAAAALDAEAAKPKGKKSAVVPEADPATVGTPAEADPQANAEESAPASPEVPAEADPPAAPAETQEPAPASSEVAR